MAWRFSARGWEIFRLDGASVPERPTGARRGAGPSCAEVLCDARLLSLRRDRLARHPTARPRRGAHGAAHAERSACTRRGTEPRSCQRAGPGRRTACRARRALGLAEANVLRVRNGRRGVCQQHDHEHPRGGRRRLPADRGDRRQRRYLDASLRVDDARGRGKTIAERLRSERLASGERLAPHPRRDPAGR